MGQKRPVALALLAPPRQSYTLEKVAEEELEETAENDDRSAMPGAGPDIKDWAKRRRKLRPGKVYARFCHRAATNGDWHALSESGGR